MRTRLFWLAVVAVTLLLASFIPPEVLVRSGYRLLRRGALEAVTVETLAEIPWLLRGLAFLAAAWLWLGPTVEEGGQATVASRRSRHVVVGAVVLAGMAIAALVRLLVLREGLISGDEWNNEFIALLMSQGRIWSAPPPHEDFFRFAYFITLPDRTVSIFPPLWPALLALGHLLGLGAWINIPVAGAAAYLAAVWNESRGAAVASAVVLALSPMYVFTAASSFASPTVLLALMGMLWCLRRVADNGPAWKVRLVGGGLLWGLCFAAHYPTALGAGLPPLVYTVWRAAKGRPASTVFFVLLGAALPLAALGMYHRALHGGPPWVPPVSLYPESMIRPGIEPAALLKGLAYTALHTVRLLGWTFPLLPLLALLAPRQEMDRLLWLSVLGLITFYALYPSAGGPQFGPRYYFGLLGPLAILGGRTLAHLTLAPRGRAFAGVLVSVALITFGVRVPREERRAARENAPFRLAAEAGVSNAIVFMQNVNQADHARNPPGWRAPVLFVPDLSGRRGELTELYPTRRLYLYRVGPNGPQIEPLRDEAAPAKEPPRVD